MSEVEKLGHLAAIDYGYTAKASFEFDGPKFLRITDLTSEGVDWQSVPQCPINEADLNKHKLEQNDIVFARTGATTGKSFLIKETPKAVAASYLIRLRLNDPRCLPEYVALYFQTKAYWDEIERGISGSAQGGFNASKLKELLIPIPPLSEQKRIVAILDEAFGAIARAKENAARNLANARELFDSYLNRVFTEKGEGWEETTVAEIAFKKKGSIRTGPFGSQLLHSEFVDEGIMVLGIDNAVNNEFRNGKRRFITQEKYLELLRYTVKPGDVIITIMGTCGRCAIVPEEIPTAINTKHLCCITLDQQKCIPEFLHIYFLHHPVARDYLTRKAKGSIMSGLNMGIIKELPVQLPNLKRQDEISKVFHKLKNEHFNLNQIYERKLAALDELKQSLLQKAFTGQLTGKASELELVK